MNQVMIDLKSSLSGVLDFIKDKNDVIYLDYPFHYNVGDLLIYQGAMLFFKEHGVSFKLLRGAKEYSVAELKMHITPSTTILCHGGGNFGDIYHVHQNLRESVVESFPNNQVIILPQTAYFSSEQALQQSAARFKRNSNVVIYSRDTRSLDVFNQFTDKVFLMPDMAHQLYGKLQKASSPSNETLYFLRVDCEISPQQEQLNLAKDIKTIDWEHVLQKKDIVLKKILMKILNLAIRTNSSMLKNMVAKIWCWHTWNMVNRYSKLFSSYSKVITSRMHGHILSCLVDTDNTLIDNSYGKNRGYYNEWTKDIDNTRLL
ncbi:polysaccharide pyruvyl transferase family protein [Serratia plymuthica]|uniref:polysaccharide pyruvyl transferase family protein n=1 Tax=Serratia plymuthica TaxID=82996 RepID=UPI001BAF90A6|nr:polysaccharide pyruvyl transferase family protein [Serratia plymuthica]QUY49813.1 polysaccharide pyruvyl transferase family protein [Serratia plymuthica]